MKIIEIDINQYSGLECLESGNQIFWDDENIADAIESSCLLAVVSSLCPETCAIGKLPLSDAWEKYYSEHASDYDLGEMIANIDTDGVALLVSKSGMACGPYFEETYFIVPNEEKSIKMINRIEE